MRGGTRVKPVTLLQTGPIHLFRTSGLYFLWQLQRTHRVILLAEDTYRTDSTFARALELGLVHDVRYYPTAAPIWQRHRWLAQTCDEVARTYQPTVALLNNHVYPQNIYLIEALRRHSPCPVLVFQNGMMTTFEKFGQQLRMDQQALFASRSHLPRHLSNLAWRLKGEVSQMANYQLLPLLTCGHPFHAPFDPSQFRIRNADISGRFDAQLSYHPIEQERYGEEWAPAPPVTLIRHPIECCGPEVWDALGFKLGSHGIAVLPSYGFITEKINTSALPPEVAMQTVVDLWLAALKALSAAFPGHPIRWKLHPAAHRDPLMNALTRSLADAIPNFEVFAPDQSAENLVLQSHVVVTDMSSILWWAAFVGEKTLVSLDIFDYAGGDELKYYQGIHHITDLSEIAQLAGSANTANRIDYAHRQTLPTLTDILP